MFPLAVPQAQGVVPTATDNRLSVGADGHGVDRILMAAQAILFSGSLNAGEQATLNRTHDSPQLALTLSRRLDGQD